MKIKQIGWIWIWAGILFLSTLSAGAEEQQAKKTNQTKSRTAVEVEGGRLGIVGVHYQSGTATLEQRYIEQLEKIALALNSGKLQSARILIKGHSDNRGSSAANRKLSLLRAQNAMKLLVKRFGVNPQRLSCKGAGESFPIASNDTADGRYLNRRIEFVYLGEIEPATETAAGKP